MSKKFIAIAAVGAIIPLALIAVVVVMIVGIVGSSQDTPMTQCGGSSLNANYSGPTIGSLTTLQMSRAETIVQVGRQEGISDVGIVIALMVASQESGFKVYANNGTSPDLKPDQKGIEKSLNLPHDKVGNDHGSLGVFQQQWPWWGTMEELMDPATSARKFYDALLAVPNWETKSLGQAAQTVQKSAFGMAYDDDEPLARQLLATLGSATSPTTSDQSVAVLQNEDGLYSGGVADCITTVAATSGVVFPLPATSGYVDRHNFGQSGDRWSSMHTGNDYSVACGTPVFAVTAGVVEDDAAQNSWAGPHFTRISTGPGQLATWYAHMESRSVSPGDQVKPGQQIGTVGTLGNSTGCHLHFEVHPTGGTIYEDPVDPVSWLAANLKPLSPLYRPAQGPGLPIGTRELKVTSLDIQGKGSDLSAVATAVTKAGTSVVALQNVDAPGDDPGAFAKRLATQLGMQYVYATNGTWKGKEHVGTAILSKFPITAKGNTRLPSSSTGKPRGLLDVTINLQGKSVKIYSAALPKAGAGRSDQAVKIAQLVGSPSCPTVLAGRFHASLGDSIHGTLTQNLTDVAPPKAKDRTQYVLVSGSKSSSSVNHGAPRPHLTAALHFPSAKGC